MGEDGAILGPRGEEQEEHTSVKHSIFDGGNPDSLCIVCHRTSVGPVIGVAKDFEVVGLARRVVAGETGVTLVFTSTSGHRVPGLEGRSIVFKATLEDASGNRVAEGGLLIDARSALRLGAKKQPVPSGEGARVREEARAPHDPSRVAESE